MPRYRLQAIITLEDTDDREAIDERIAIVTESARTDPTILAVQLVDRVEGTREPIDLQRPAM